jgi:L-alanine-DL-glutamate epimerase-like enolase superfamily enzyme
MTEVDIGTSGSRAYRPGCMRITQVEAIPYALPVRRVARFASGARERADHVLVRVHTDEGLVGQAEAQPRPYTYGETQASIVAALDWLSTALEGLDPLATERVAERCAALEGNNVARAAVDLAVWDVAGKVLGRSCRELLGGYAADVAAAHMVSYDAPAAMAEEALEYHERLGIRTFKVKVGRDVDVDLEACAAIRAALPAAELYVDANRGWSYEQALRAGDALAELGISAIEEPIAVDDRTGRRRLAERWGVPVIGDESCMTLAHTARALDEGAVRMVSVKVARTGFTESRRIVGLCLGYSATTLAGSQYEGALGALATAAFAPALAATAQRAAEVMNYTDLADDLLARPIEIREGRIVPPDAAGLGIEIDEDKLAYYRLDEALATA